LTDASDRFYAGLVTQKDEEQLDLPMEEQDHQPLAILSVEFKGVQLRWTVPEKEGFAIFDTVTKVEYLLLSHDEFSILFDHLNLTYIYNPLLADPTLARHVVQKLQRLALKMSVFYYRMKRDGRAQLLDRPHYEVGSRVGSRQRDQSAWQDGQPVCTAIHQPARLRYGEVTSKKDILLVQQSAVYEYERFQQGNAMARQELPPQKVGASGMKMMNNALWIPERAVELQLRLCVEARCRSAGHRAHKTTLGAIKEYMAWITMAKDVKVFVQNCLHCVATMPEDKEPRPLGTQLHATKPSEILHFDLL
jgi:hypothetical protein